MKQLVIMRKGEAHTVLLDNKYYELISKYKWHIDAWGYARRNYIEPGGKTCALFLHNFIWFLETGEAYQFNKGLSVDHINRNKLDNQVSNLRKADNSLQGRNKKMPNKTGYKGVYFRKENKSKPYQTMISENRKNRSLGYYATAEEAYEVYKAAYKKLHNCYPVA